MATQIESMFAQQLHERKQRLEEAVGRSNNQEELAHLLRDVDMALDKISKGTYGLCETCKEPIEAERLAVDPLVRYCIDHLSVVEQKALERDLELARQIQVGLLPRKDLNLPGWESAYHYEPSGAVSGDYCDVIVNIDKPDSFFFIVGDVAGKGVAASILMSQLHATFRTLTRIGLPLNQLMERANRIFCEASLTTHFATLVCGLADSNGEVDICNAGHCLPLALRHRNIEKIPPSGLPLGIACDGKYSSTQFVLDHGEDLVMYTDGLSEATNESGEGYAEERLMKLLTTTASTSPADLVSTCLRDLRLFVGHARRADDLTLLVLRRK